MVNIFENKEKLTFYLISENCSLVECKLTDLEKISAFYNEIYYRQDVEDYFEESDKYSLDILDDNELLNEITSAYAKHREEAHHDWNTCLETAISEFSDELMKYLNR